MRGKPVGLGHEPVVQMCPQKWKASLSSGRTAAATAAPPVTASMAPPIRPRKQRRVRPPASRVERLRATPSTSSSGRRIFDPFGSEDDQLLELLERVRCALGGDDSVHDVHRERSPRDGPALEGLWLLVLVDDVHGQALAAERTHRRSKLPAQAAARAEEDSQLVADTLQLLEVRHRLAELRPFLCQLERDPRPYPESENADLSVEGQHEGRKNEDGEREHDEADEEEALPRGRRDVERKVREGGEPREPGCSQKEELDALLLGAEAAAVESTNASGACERQRADEESSQAESGKGCEGRPEQEEDAHNGFDGRERVVRRRAQGRRDSVGPEAVRLAARSLRHGRPDEDRGGENTRESVDSDHGLVVRRRRPAPFYPHFVNAQLVPL